MLIKVTSGATAEIVALRWWPQSLNASAMCARNPGAIGENIVTRRPATLGSVVARNRYDDRDPLARRRG